MGIDRMGVPAELVTALRIELQATAFVETGTYRGNTTAWASGEFERVVSLEQARVFYEAAQLRFRDVANVELCFGHSGKVLEPALRQLLGPTVFWLDAHWSGGETYGEGDECPLLDELAVINRRTTADAILIDDARLFLAPSPAPHNPEQWPNIAEVCLALGAPERRYVVVTEDVIIAVPHAAKRVVQDYVQRRATPPTVADQALEDTRRAAKSLWQLAQATLK